MSVTCGAGRTAAGSEADRWRPLQPTSSGRSSDRQPDGHTAGHTRHWTSCHTDASCLSHIDLSFSALQRYPQSSNALCNPDLVDVVHRVYTRWSTSSRPPPRNWVIAAGRWGASQFLSTGGLPRPDRYGFTRAISSGCPRSLEALLSRPCYHCREPTKTSEAVNESE